MQYIYQYAMIVGRPPGCNLTSLVVFKDDIPKVLLLIYLIHHQLGLEVLGQTMFYHFCHLNYWFLMMWVMII